MTTKSDLPKTLPSRLLPLTQVVTAHLFRASATLRAKFATAGQMADFISWQRNTFGRPLSMHQHREKLWEHLAQRIDRSRPLVAWEFGVAHGYSTSWWLNRLAAHDVEWHGFDRFTGLPRAWNAFGEGAFDNGGNPPTLADPRARWHVGDVEDTLTPVERGDDAQWLIMFDLDIYEPTAYAWSILGDHMRTGDLIYLDEAYDRDERRVLDELILPSVKCDAVGVTPAALALEIR